MDTEQTKSQAQLKDDAANNAAVGIAYAFGGIIIGLVAICAAFLVEGIAISFAESFTGKAACGEGFGTPITLALIAIGIGTSLLTGYKLYHWRRYVGGRGNPEDEEFASMIRRRYTYAVMITYAIFAPLSWLYIIAAANCAG